MSKQPLDAGTGNAYTRGMQATKVPTPGDAVEVLSHPYGREYGPEKWTPGVVVSVHRAFLVVDTGEKYHAYPDREEREGMKFWRFR